ncbi:MAG: efflux RND transporter periplasmic adaptor subunit [Candidatus Rokuibacteriota bacterium]
MSTRSPTLLMYSTAKRSITARAIVSRRASGQVRRERGLEPLGGRVIEAPRGKERHRVGEALRGQLHDGSDSNIGPAVAHWGVLEKSDLLNQLRIDRSEDRPRRRRTRLYVVAVIVLLLVGGGLWFGVVRARPLEVQITVARAAGQGAGAGSVLDASGYVTARRQATVSAKITGKVTEVLIEEGMRVREGAVLARLDDKEARAQVELARAQVAAARAEVAEVRAQLRQAERDHARQQELYDRQLVSPQSLDAARAQRDTLRARLISTERQIQVAEESLALAQVQLDNTVIRAPFSGVVVAKSAQPGEMISPISAGGGFTRTGIGTIVDMDSLEIQVDVNESYINRVMPEQAVEATLNAYPDWKIPGAVIAIIPTADRSKATVKVRIAIEQKDTRIVPDMGVRVAFLRPPSVGSETPAESAAAVLVPVEAVQAEGDRGVVFVLAGDRVERRGVTLGPAVGRQRQVLAGLRDGERVVLSPPESLEDGDAVKLAEGGSG